MISLINENIAAGVHYIKPKLNAVRKYLTKCRMTEFSIGDQEKKFIEEDFINMREENKLQIENLHSLLVVSRLIALSLGKTSLDIDSWNAAKELELERISRDGNLTEM